MDLYKVQTSSSAYLHGQMNTDAPKFHITLDIEGIPPQAAVRQSLDTVLKPHCNVQTCDFDENAGICTAIAYAQSPATIPATRILGLSYTHGTDLHSFPLNIRASRYAVPEKQATTQGFPLKLRASHNAVLQKKTTTQWAQNVYAGTENTDASNNYDPELDEDPDVVREAFEEPFAKQKEDEEAWNTRYMPKNNFSFHDYSSDSSFGPNNYEHADPDREPQCWKHGGQRANPTMHEAYVSLSVGIITMTLPAMPSISRTLLYCHLLNIVKITSFDWCYCKLCKTVSIVL